MLVYIFDRWLIIVWVSLTSLYFTSYSDVEYNMKYSLRGIHIKKINTFTLVVIFFFEFVTVL